MHFFVPPPLWLIWPPSTFVAPVVLEGQPVLHPSKWVDGPLIRKSYSGQELSDNMTLSRYCRIAILTEYTII